MTPAFDNEKYLSLQSARIRQRIDEFGGKLYLEFGGKLFDDYHASRVLPGFKPDSKVKMLLELKEDVEIVIVINAEDIEKSKRRGDLDITYDLDVLRLTDAFRSFGLFVGSVVITHYNSQPAAQSFEKRLGTLGIKVFKHYVIEGYPANVPLIVSQDGYGRNDYIATSHSLIVVTAPGPGSGKMAVCLSQLYHEYLKGIKAGYAKFETFPIWNLPLKHPVNLAYEAATVDLADMNMIDPFHLEAYGQTAVSYNRDVEIFPVLSAIFQKIQGYSPYKSPTDMGVNMVGRCIIDDDAACQGARQEVIRRFYGVKCALLQGLSDKDQLYKLELLMNQMDISPQDRPAVSAALERAADTGQPSGAIVLNSGEVITGKTSDLLGACSAMLLNALKKLAGLPHNMHIISPIVIEPIQELKVKHMGNRNPRLHTDEVLIALSISAATNPAAKLAINQLAKLQGCQAHSSVMLAKVDESVFKKLGIDMTSEPVYETHKLYRS